MWALVKAGVLKKFFKNTYECHGIVVRVSGYWAISINVHIGQKVEFLNWIKDIYIYKLPKGIQSK